MQTQRGRRAGRILGAAGWAVIVAAVLAAMLAGSPTSSAGLSVLVWSLVVFFAIQIARLGVTIVTDRARRAARGLLLLSVVLWAAGAAVLNAASAPELTRFPAPGEVFFLASYVAMAAYLVVDAGRRWRMPADAWLHVLVLCGGTACLAGAVLLVPAANAYQADGLRLFLALLYPLIDVVLAVLVVGQAVLRLREDRRASWGLLAGFLLFAFADAHFVTNLATDTYSFSRASDVAWGAGFALIVAAACRPAAAAARTVPRRQGPAETLAAAAVAVGSLALHPDPRIALYLTIPAVLTLVGAGGRLVLALREARHAAEAVTLARTDDLTRLPNRRALRAGMDQALATERPLALAVLDVDGFKDVNDTLGHAAGDDVLRLIAHRLRDALPPAVLVARLGGDEFALLFDDWDVVSTMEIAQRLLQVLREPVRVEGVEILPNASVGIADRPDQAVTGAELLRRADVAMYQAKTLRAGVALYDPLDDEFSKSRLMLAEDLRRALAEDRQLELWYQPQIDAASGQPYGFEGLLRWRHPAQGLLTPAAFLPMARRAGLMPALSQYVARLAVRDRAQFRRAGVDIPVSVNCAPPELLGGGFVSQLQAALREAGVPARGMVIEVTEDSFMADPERARHLLQAIRQDGLQVSIDDYGTGFSSLAYLRDLAVDELKIDRTFVATMTTDPRSQMIVASTLQLATALSMRTVAEGVEDADTAADLVRMGVDGLQGYHIAAPMPAHEVPSWYAQWTLRGAAVLLPTANAATRSARVLPVRRAPSWPGLHR